MSSKCTAIKNELREMIFQLEQEHNIKLSTTQKILLSINGPVTPILDVLYGEVRLFMLDQHFDDPSMKTFKAYIPLDVILPPEERDESGGSAGE